MTYSKRLIEVDLPIKRISTHARREKSIRHGHISTLHIWWARRPLAACRAVICAALWPDPADAHCPPAFREEAARILPEFAEQVRTDTKLANLCTPESWSRWNRTTASTFSGNYPGAWLDMRYALLDFIADFANWDASTVPAYLETARALTQAAHEALGGQPGTRPLVVDPFAGGGAIPLEALRVGADAFASDLNPVAVLLNKVVLEYIPKYGQQLADEVRKWGQWIKEQAEKELAEFYPPDPDGATPIAYLWARTVTCEGPGCGTEVPLMRTLWLSRRNKNSVALRLVPLSSQKRIDFDIIVQEDKHWVRQNDPTAIISDPDFEGTVRRGSITCPVCGYTTPVESVRKQLKSQHGGAATARLFTVVTAPPKGPGRSYRLPLPQDLVNAQRAHQELEHRKKTYIGYPSLIPDERYPGETGSGAISSSVLYGFEEWGDLFNPRQALSLSVFVRLVRDVGEKMGSAEQRDAVVSCLALAIDRLADRCSSLCTWDPSPAASGILHTFGRQALPIIWDFAEGDPTSEKSGGWTKCLSWVLSTLEEEARSGSPSGVADLADAQIHPLPDDTVNAFVTDPPYYDAIAYGDLSDFFYVWLRRALKDIHPRLFGNHLVDKTDEIVHLSKRFRGPYSHKTKEYFEGGMTQALAEARRYLNPYGIGVVVFAHKSTSGWESMLQALLDGGWTVTGSWPIDTEMSTRMNAMGTAALASSIHLVCRPRENGDGVVMDNIGDWRDVLQELPTRIHAWLPRLANEGVVGADALFACLGPALEVFSRHSHVERANGEIVTLGEYLEHVWAAVSKEALTMIFEGADTTGFEEDARLTAAWLWTLSAGATNGEDGDKVVASTGYALEYDAARKIAQGLGAHLEQLPNLVEVKGGTAVLLPVSQRARYLFGKEGINGSRRVPQSDGPKQLSWLESLPVEEAAEWALPETGATATGATTLDRIHQSMLLFAAGKSDALRRFLVDDGIGGDERFWRLAQALSALYPSHTDEKRWVDGVLARKKSLGF